MPTRKAQLSSKKKKGKKTTFSESWKLIRSGKEIKPTKLGRDRSNFGGKHHQGRDLALRGCYEGLNIVS